MGTNLFDLKGFIVLVTGSSQGIGFTFVRGIAQHGALPIINQRNAQKVEAVISVLKDAGINTHSASFDVTDDASVRAGVTEIEARLGAIDILVNNAGMQFRSPLDDFSNEKWDVLFKTNVSSAFYVSKVVMRQMILRGRGKIINIAFVQSELAKPGIAPVYFKVQLIKLWWIGQNLVNGLKGTHQQDARVKLMNWLVLPFFSYLQDHVC